MRRLVPGSGPCSERRCTWILPLLMTLASCAWREEAVSIVERSQAPAEVEPSPLPARTIRPFIRAELAPEQQDPDAFVIPPGMVGGQFPGWIELGPYGKGVLSSWHPESRKLSDKPHALPSASTGAPVAFGVSPGDVIARLPNSSIAQRLFLFRSYSGADTDWTLSTPRALTSIDAWEARQTRIYLSTPAHRPARGTVIHLSGLSGPTSEWPVVRRLVSDGWCVITLLPTGMGTRPGAIMLDSGNPETRRSRRSSSLETFVERARARLGQYSRLTNDMLAETFYAAEGMLEFCACEHPEIPQSPLVVIGFSYGALSAPAVATELGDRVGSVVLFAGGGCMWEISQTTELFPSRYPKNWRKQLVELTREESLRATPLDPLCLASRIRGRKLLVVHAAFDAIVPASTGDRLHEALGKPERWTYPLGHIGLFFALPFIAGDIVDWIDRAEPENDVLP